MLRAAVFFSLLASVTLAIPPLNTDRTHEFFIASRIAAPVANALKSTTDLHHNLISTSIPKLLSAKRPINPTSTTPHLSTVVRPGLSGESCAELAECESPRTCAEIDDGENVIPCAGGNCFCAPPDPTCSSTADCSVGESCASDSGFCFANVLLDGETLDFEACSSAAQCASGRSCFGVSLTNGMLDCSVTSCSCIEVSSTCATFQDCLVGTSCTRISPEIPASFCVSNSFIVGNFGGGLSGANCATDVDCAGGRECVVIGDDGNLSACGGETACFCGGGGNNILCSSSRFCDFGETCVDLDGVTVCLPISDVI